MPKSIKRKNKSRKHRTKKHFRRSNDCDTFEAKRFRKLVAELKRKNDKKVHEKKVDEQKNGQPKDIVIIKKNN